MANRRPKISVIGAGFVGSTCAHWAASKELGDVVLIDINGDAAKGKALDLFEASPVEGFDSNVVGGSDYALTKDSDVVVITAGLPRKPGMSRDDLLATNAKIVKECAQNVAKFSPNCVLIVVSNPLDAMCHVAMDATGFPRERVLGMAGVLDSARFRSFIAMECNVSVEDVQAFVFGGHGDTMVPMPRYVSVGGVPLTQMLPKERIDAIVDRTRKGGAEIVELLKTGSAYYAPAASAVQMVEAIVRDKKRILPCAVNLKGEYGVTGLFVGVLAKLGAKGLEGVPTLEMNAEEKDMFGKSAAAVKGLVDDMKRLGLS
ncbi:MAG: malate dehydrogenase [Bdellovibrionales bacterium]|nr:malate dehydrogenase [Bdellovibrionales bacterium]